MLRNYSIITLALLVVACLSYARMMSHELDASRANERAIALRASNLEALHDTTRALGFIGDSLHHAFIRRVVQVAQPQDHPAHYAMRVALDTLAATVTAASRDTIPFHIRDEPYTVDAVVAGRSGGDSTTLAFHVAIDTIHLVARIECAPGADAGIRNASLMTTAPPWAAVKFGEVQQAPEVCNPSPPQRITRRRFLSWAPVALSVGRQLGSGTAGWSAQIGTAITFGAR